VERISSFDLAGEDGSFVVIEKSEQGNIFEAIRGGMTWQTSRVLKSGFQGQERIPQSGADDNTR